MEAKRNVRLWLAGQQGGEVLRAILLGHSLSGLGTFRQKILLPVKGASARAGWQVGKT